MRILVVVAQPLGLSKLSVEEEADVIRSGFRRLLDANLAQVQLLLEATRRSLGLPMVIVALVFIFYTFAGTR